MSTYSYSSSREHDVTVKVVLIGDLGVGKTTFLQTLIAGKYTPRSKNSPDVQESREKILMHNGKHIRLQFWDTAGQERYRSLTASYYRGAHACVILFDVGNATSFENVHRWYQDIRDYSSLNDLAIVLVGTKCHLTDREVEKEYGEAFAKEHDIPYMEVSAERNIDSVNKVCEKLIDIVLEKHISTHNLARSETKLLKKKEKRKKSWCSC